VVAVALGAVALYLARRRPEEAPEPKPEPELEPAPEPEPEPPAYDPARHIELLPIEAALAEAAGAHAERVWSRIAAGRYTRPEALWAEVSEAASRVSDLFDGDAPRLGDALGATRDAAAQLLERAAEVPFIDLPSWTTNDLVRRLASVEKARSAWQVAGPYVTAAVWTSRFLRGVHPAWQIAGGALETAATRWTQRHLAGLVEAMVALMYVHLARACDPELGRYATDARVLDEALRVHAAAPGIDANRRRLLVAINEAALADEGHRRTLLRLLAADAPPPGALPDYRPLPAPTRRALASRLTTLLGDLNGLSEPCVRDVLGGLEYRLGHGLALDYLTSSVSAGFKVREGLVALAAVARARLGDEASEAAERLRETPFASEVKRLLPNAADEIPAAVDAAYADLTAPFVPRALCGDPTAGPWCDALVQLLDREPGPWCAADDELALVSLSTLLPARADFERRWRGFLGRARARLRGARTVGTLEVPDAATSRLVLRALSTDAVLVDATLADVSTGDERRKRSHWVAFTEGAVLLGPVPPEGDWLGDLEATRFDASQVGARRLRGITADDLELRLGDGRYILEGAVSATFRARFESVLSGTGVELGT